MKRLLAVCKKAHINIIAFTATTVVAGSSAASLISGSSTPIIDTAGLILCGGFAVANAFMIYKTYRKIYPKKLKVK